MGEGGGEKLNSYPPHLYPVKYELFDLTHLESMQQDTKHGYLSILFNRVKVRGYEFNCPPPPLPTGRQAHPPPSKGEGIDGNQLFTFEGDEPVMKDSYNKRYPSPGIYGHLLFWEMKSRTLPRVCFFCTAHFHFESF